MRSVTLKSHVGEDGVLHLQVPVGVKNATLEVVVVFQTTTPAEATDERGWPVGFFEETAGAWSGEPLDRGEQGTYERREELVFSRTLHETSRTDA
jgi:hypothetical protein